MPLETFPYDPADFLTDDATISAYLTVSLEEDDPAYFVRALGAVARAKKRLPELAQDLGISVEQLDGMLRDGSKVGMEMTLVIARLLGVKLSAFVSIASEKEHASAV